MIDLKAVVALCNTFPEVTWDRYIVSFADGFMAIYGWIPKLEGEEDSYHLHRFDFLLLQFGDEPGGGMWGSMTTSSQEYSATFDRRMEESGFTSYATTPHEERSCRPVQELEGLRSMVPRAWPS